MSPSGSGHLPPGHVCRRDDLTYESVFAWYRDQRVPTAAARALSQLIRRHNLTFAEPCTALVSSGALVMLDDEVLRAGRP